MSRAKVDGIIAPKVLIQVNKSTWCAGIKEGRFPRPIKLSARITVWRVEDTRTLIETGAR